MLAKNGVKFVKMIVIDMGICVKAPIESTKLVVPKSVLSMIFQNSILEIAKGFLRRINTKVPTINKLKARQI